MADTTTAAVDAGGDLDAFRARCKAFLDEHATAEPGIGQLDPRGDLALAGAKAFQAKLADAGLAGLGYPVEYGGQGLDDSLRRDLAGRSGPLPLDDPPALDQPRHVHPDRRRVRHRRAEGGLPGQADPGRRGVVPDVLRAGRRLRRRQPPDPGGARRRRVGAQRPEGVDHPRPPLRPGDHHRPHRPRPAEAPGHLDVHRRHAGAGGGGPPDQSDRRRQPLQRDLLHRRPHPGRPADRPAQRGLAARDRDADVRAGGDRHRATGRRAPRAHRPPRRGRVGPGGARRSGATQRSGRALHRRGQPELDGDADDGRSGSR